MKWSEVTQSCPTLCDPMDCSLPGSAVRGIFQARVLEWVAISNLPQITQLWTSIHTHAGLTTDSMSSTRPIAQLSPLEMGTQVGRWAPKSISHSAIISYNVSVGICLTRFSTDPGTCLLLVHTQFSIGCSQHYLLAVRKENSIVLRHWA